VVVVAEAIGAARGYVPSYFDSAYAMERRGVPQQGFVPKSELAEESTFWGKAKLELTLGRLRFGASSISNFARTTHVSLHTELSMGHWRVGATAVQRFLASSADLFTRQATTFIAAEGAFRILGGLYVFAQGSRRPTQGRLAGEGMLGLGYAAGGDV